MKKFIYYAITALIVIISGAAEAQTNVSGSLHSNTTWTLANSPYHITANLYVFPGVTLTIEPGVKVIFDGNYTLEVRGKIKAVGTSSSKIYFCGKMVVTGNDTFYTLWNKVLIDPLNKGTGEFKHCVFKDAESALEAYGVKSKVNYCLFENNGVGIYGYNIFNSTPEELTHCTFQYNRIGVAWVESGIISNCTFNKNDQGMYVCMRSRLINCTFLNNRNGLNIVNGNIYNCTFTYNKHAIKAPSFDGSTLPNLDTIRNCTITYNEIGIEDSASGAGVTSLIINNVISQNKIGYMVSYAGDITNTYPALVKNNKICGNTQYNVVNANKMNKNFTDNCFCTDDSTEIENKIYDGYDDPQLGLLTYNIYDEDCENKLSNTFKNLPVQDKDTGCATFAECLKFTRLHTMNKKSTTLTIFPNPCETAVNLKIDESLGGTLKVYDSYGRLVLEKVVDASSSSASVLDVANWNEGVYRIELVQGDLKSVGSFIKL